jgi:hypothetical protein
MVNFYKDSIAQIFDISHVKLVISLHRKRSHLVTSGHTQRLIIIYNSSSSELGNLTYVAGAIM